MGKIYSKFKLRNEKSLTEEDLQKYEDQTENSPFSYGLQDTGDLRKIAWYQRLVYDLRFRIGYALVIAILLGVAIPILLHSVFYDTSDSTIYGSCLIKNHARFQCLINNVEPASRQECVHANCCWEENDSLQFKCFHSFPSAYQYRASAIQQLSTENGVIITVSPNHPEKMSKLSLLLKWESESRLNLRIFNPDHFPDRDIPFSQLLPDSKGFMDRNGIIVNYGAKDEYFFIQLVRMGSVGNETLFDTRLGMLHGGDGFMSFSTTLPTPYFYGLSGGEGIASKGTLTFSVMNGFKNSELPFYMALENSKSWHGFLLETTLPFMTQILQAPGIGFYLEGPKAEVNAHFFIGPNSRDVLRQVHSYISEKVQEESGTARPPYIPPYWGLGVHLCRKASNASDALRHIQELNEVIDADKGITKIPYDSDCIDEDLRTPFGINYTAFPHEELEEITNQLERHGKRIVFTQKVTIPYSANETDISEVEDFILMQDPNPSNSQPFIGTMGNQTVIYLDVFHPNIFDDIDLWNFDFGNISYHGLILLENYPVNEEINPLCKPPSSFLQKHLFTSIAGQEEPAVPLGSVCPEILHKVPLDEENENGRQSHLELHNAFGHRSLQKFAEILPTLANPEMDADNLLLATSSGWTDSLYYGAHNGKEVEFSWIALRESVVHVLEKSMLSPVSGTPICGSYLPNETSVFDMNLCLRWYQFALLLPHVFHSYTHGNESRGPLDFPPSYQNYLKQAIQLRYTFAPYYYSLLAQYQTNYVPMILPMSFHFVEAASTADRETLFRLVDQFMIGDSILAAPVVKPELNRETYFPAGTWYDPDGYVAWNDGTKGGFTTVTGHLVQTPIFLRGGRVIPVMENPLGNSISESRAGNYSLMVALDAATDSVGFLYADQGMRNGTPIYSEIRFWVSSPWESESSIQLNVTIEVQQDPVCEMMEGISTIIDQIKIFGYPIKYGKVGIEYVEHPEINLEPLLGDEMNFMRFGGLNYNWCFEQIATLNIIGSLE